MTADIRWDRAPNAPKDISAGLPTSDATPARPCGSCLPARVGENFVEVGPVDSHFLAQRGDRDAGLGLDQLQCLSCAPAVAFGSSGTAFGASRPTACFGASRGAARFFARSCGRFDRDAPRCEAAPPEPERRKASWRTVFTSRQRILAGDWTMQRASSLPPDARDPTSAGTCVPRPIAYDLPALFAANG